MILTWNSDQLLNLTKERKQFEDDVMQDNCDAIATFPIYGQFGAIQKPDSGRIVCKAYIFISSNLLSYKN